MHRRGYHFIAEIRPLAATAAAPLTSPPFDLGAGSIVGREAALAQLAGALQRTRCGERQILFVTGERGIGKTALVDTLLRSPPAIRRSAAHAASAPTSSGR